MDDDIFTAKSHSEKALEKMRENKKGKYVGESNPKAKLNWEKVNKIRELYASGSHLQREIAEMFEVSDSCIMYILTNRSWKRQGEQIDVS
jgi:hypothetical protein